MLEKNNIKFFTALKDNNNKAWFEINRTWYEETRLQFEKLVDGLIKGISSFDNDTSTLLVKSCTFRQYRDVRFSKDKRPYKTNMGAYFNKGGKKKNTAGYYFHFEPGKSMIAGGLWMPESFQLAKVRQEIDYNFPEWKSIITQRNFVKHFISGLSKEDSLKRAPKGYDEANPAIEQLKLKSFIAKQMLSNNELLAPDLVKKTITSYRSLKPFIDFLNRASD
ncbi:MAG: DUF2461 domain-containing protein [Ferruginibacter sp.]